MTDKIFKAKQDWFDRLLASKHTHAQLRFALCIFQHMFGEKIESWPTTEDIMDKGGFNSSGHFKDFRDALVASGALTAVLDYHTKGAKQKNYKYTLNLDWDGSVAPEGIAVAPEGISGSTSGDCRSTSGASNTSTNTPRVKTENKTTTSATAPVDNLLFDEEDIPSSILSLNPSFEDIVSPLVGDPRFSFDEPTPTDAPTPSLNRHLVKEIEDAVEGIAKAEGWEEDFTAQVRTMVLDASFEEKNISAGSRIWKAKNQLTVKEADNIPW